MTGFDIVDRYDFVASLLIGAVAAGAIVIGAPWWAVPLIAVVGWTALFMRHFDEIMWPK